MLSAVFKYCSITLLILPLILTVPDTGQYFSKLKTAVSDYDLDTVYQLLLQNTTDWWEIARVAAENGNLRMIEYIGQHKLSILGKKNEKNETIGHIAAEHGHPNITEYFLKKIPWWNRRFGGILSDIEKASLFDLVARKGYLNCISNIIMSPDDADLERIGRIAADNGHLGIACYMAIRQNNFDSHAFEGIIVTALEKSREREVDPETLELFGKLTVHWQSTHCPHVLGLAEYANRIDLIEYLAEKKCAYFLHKYSYSADMWMAFKQNIVNQRFLECLEKANGTIQGCIGFAKETICHIAANYGRLDVIRFMTGKNSSILEKANMFGRTVVDIAAEKGHGDIVRYVLRLNPSSVVQYRDGLLPQKRILAFHFAIAKNFMDMDTLKYVVEKDSSLVMRHDRKNGKTAAHMAAANGNMEILRYLVKKDESVFFALDNGGNTIRHILARNNNISRKEFDFFFNDPVFILKANSHQQTVGHIAAESGNLELLQYLTKIVPAVLFASDDRGNTILHILAEHNALSKEWLEFFVNQRARAPMNAKNIANQTVGHILAENEHTDSLEYLVETKPSILTIQDENGDTVLHLLARKDALSVKNLEFFVDKGASLILKNNKNENIPILTAMNGNLEIFRCVVRKEPAVLTGNAGVGDLIVDVAARRGHSNVLKLIAKKAPALLADKPDVLFKLSNSWEVLGVLRRLKAACETSITNFDRLHFENEVLRNALEHDYADIFEFMEYDVNMVFDQGEPLIFTTVRRNWSNLFHYLAENRRTNLTALDREGNNILFVATRRHDLKKMRYILDTMKTPIDIEWRNNEGYTVLHVSVHEALSRVDKARDVHQFQVEHQNAMDVIKYLVEEKHAQVNARGHNNKTALHWAMSRANFDISNYLLNHGGDPKLRDADEKNFWQALQFTTLKAKTSGR